MAPMLARIRELYGHLVVLLGRSGTLYAGLGAV